MKISVSTDTGYKAEIQVEPTRTGHQVRTAAYLFRGVLSPWIVLKEFTGPDSEKRAGAYADSLARALVGKDLA